MLLHHTDYDHSGHLGKLTRPEEKALEKVKGLCAAAGYEGFGDRECLRYLRARGFHVDGTMQMIRATVEWRKNQPVTPPPLSKFRELYERGECLPHGRDKAGRLTYFQFSRNHDPDTSALSAENVLNVMRNFAAECDKHPEGPEQFSVVFDMTGMASENRDPHLIRALVDCLQNHHPERLGMCVIINAPPSFNVMWALYRTWLSPRTVRKVTFIGGYGWQRKLRLLFDEDQLVPCLGGTSPVTPQAYINERCGPPSRGVAAQARAKPTAADKWRRSWWTLGVEMEEKRRFNSPVPQRKDHGLRKVDPSPYRQSWWSLGFEFDKAPLTIHEKRAEGGTRAASAAPPPYPSAQGHPLMWGGPVAMAAVPVW